jgi:hypothetical protein
VLSVEKANEGQVAALKRLMLEHAVLKMRKDPVISFSQSLSATFDRIKFLESYRSGGFD